MVGPCQYLTCRSALGSEFRAYFRSVSRQGARHAVLLCPDHTRFCEELRDESYANLYLSDEGVVYPSLMMESLLA